MSDTPCPDCNSQDVQKVEEKQIFTTSTNRVGLVIYCVIGCGIFGFLMGILTGDPGNAFVGAFVCGLFFGVPLGFVWNLFVKSEDSVQTSHVYYVCRSCGREYRSN